MNRGISRRSFLAGAAMGIVTMAIGAGNLALAEEFGPTAETAAALSNAQAEYEAATVQLGILVEQTEQAQYALDKTRAELEVTNASIAQLEASIAEKQTELSAAQDVLADRISANYEAGGTNALEVILDSQNFEDFVNRVFLANKIADSDAQMIQEVKDIKADLEEQESALQTQRAQQEALAAQQEIDAANLEAQVTEMQEYTDGLSEEVVALMEQAEAETLAAKEAAYQQYLAELAAQEAAAQAAAAQSTTTEYVTTTEVVTDYVTETVTETVTEVDEETGEIVETEVTHEVEVPVETEVEVVVPVEVPNPDPVYEEPTYYEEPSYGSGNHVSAAADIAWSYIGVPYVWGGSDPSGFDCSGLAMYCYAMAGYSIERTTYGQIAMIQNAGNWQSSMDACGVGDLVFPHSGHVGIYCGGGMMIHAPQPNDVVKYASVYAFMGGGCPV